MKFSSKRLMRGFTAIGLMVVLIVTASALSVGFGYLKDYTDGLANQSAATHAIKVADATTQYVKDNNATLLAQPSFPVSLTVSTLQSAGYLANGFSSKNPFQQNYAIQINKTASNKLDTLIVTTGGETIAEMGIRRTAQIIGASGGYISSTDTANANGSFGGWQIPVANFGVNPGAGHIAVALFFSDGALVSDYLYRNNVPGHPELNQMNTNLDMNGKDLSGANGLVGKYVVPTLQQVDGTPCPTYNLGTIAQETATGKAMSCVLKNGNQIWKRVGVVPTPVVVTLTTTQNWTVPDGVTVLDSVEVVGAGGGGSHSGTYGSYGYTAVSTSVAVTPGATLLATIGSGGAPAGGVIYGDCGSNGDQMFADPGPHSPYGQWVTPGGLGYNNGLSGHASGCAWSFTPYQFGGGGGGSSYFNGVQGRGGNGASPASNNGAGGGSGGGIGGSPSVRGDSCGIGGNPTGYGPAQRPSFDPNAFGGNGCVIIKYTANL